MTVLDVASYTGRVFPADVESLVRDFLHEWTLGDYLDHWSPTSLTDFRRCPHQWQLAKIQKHKKRPGEAPVVGFTVHAAFDRNFSQKIRTHEDLPLVDLLDWYMAEGFAEVVISEQEKTGLEVRWDTDPESARQRGYQMIAAYMKGVAPRIQPLSTETKIVIDVGAPVPVEGRYDLLREESAIDYKTGSRVRRSPKDSWRFQGSVYAEATGKPVEFHSISASETKNSVTIVTPLEAEALLVAPTAKEQAEMRRTIQTISAEACMYMTLFGPDEPWPTHGVTNDWACNPKWCQFRPICPAWED